MKHNGMLMWKRPPQDWSANGTYVNQSSGSGDAIEMRTKEC